MTMKNMNLDKYSPFHKTGHTSKGNQRKWEIDGIWYKADYMGYESLAEVLVSRLLKKSSLKYPFVTYDPAKIEYNNSSMNACISQDFRKEGQVLIPLEKLFRQYTGESLAVKLAEFDTQLEAAEELFGTQLEFHFTIQDIHQELEKLADFYPEDIRQRVELLMHQQMRKYAYLITK